MRLRSFLAPIIALGFLLGMMLTDSRAESSTEPTLTGKWHLEQIGYADRSSDRNIADSSFYLFLNTEGGQTFQLFNGKDRLIGAGEWSNSGRRLILENDTLSQKNAGMVFLQGPNDSTSRTHLSIDSLSQRGMLLTRGNHSFKFSSLAPVIHEGLSFYSVFRGLIGIATIILLGVLFSMNRSKIDWALIVKGLVLQLILAILILKVGWVELIFEWLSEKFVALISFANVGSDFLFRSTKTGEVEPAIMNFVTRILPSIIFFSALTSMFYYLGVLQKIVYGFAWVMKRFMNLSGAESLAAAGNVFLGQTESPFLIKPYLPKMTRSEIMCLMSGGMATIAGGVLVAYIGFLGGDDPVERAFFAKHLLTASVMSAPAAIVASKLLVPEVENFDKELTLGNEKFGANVLEAITNGTGDGLKLAVNVAAMLLVFLALIALGNAILEDYVGHYTGLNEFIKGNTENYDGLTFQFIIGYLFSPIAWLMGVASEDIVLVGQLLGEKTIVNEFVAYKTLGEMKSDLMFTQQKSIIMSTYILCGFANFASIGIQIGGIGALIPNRKGLLSKLGVRALIGGTLACLFTAVIVGMLGVS